MSTLKHSQDEKFFLLNWLKGSLIGNLVGLLSPWRSSSYLLGYSDIITAIFVCLVIISSPFTSNTLVGIILLAGGGFWVLLTVSDIDKNQITPIHLCIFAYWLISVAATAFSPLKMAALSGLVKFTLYLLLFALASRVFAKKKMRSLIMSTYLLVSLIVSAYGVRQQFIGVKPLATWTDPTSPLADTTRVYSFLGNPNLLAGYLIPAVAFSVVALIVWKTKPQKILAGFALVINVACVYFTGSRGGWLALIGTGIIFLLGFKFWWNDYLSPFWRKWLIPTVIASFLLLVGVAMIFVEPLRIRIFSLFSWRGDSSNNFRINVWISALQMLQDYPLIGIGPGNEVFNQIYPLYMQTKFTALSAYCIFLEIALETGLIGLFSFLAVIVATFKRGMVLIKKMKPSNDLQAIWILGAIASLAGLATQGLFDTVWYRPQINTLWWLCVAIVAAVYSLKSETDNHVS
ncbi:IctB family putative bicarbonate transporter [Cyanobacterium aponinum]|uniref:Putative bicarbonate transporter, IctB family n=1 Tax=Cyanobacterium aponinum 0216 TaxID=2676140 RepID=A0A844H3J4_9CHRO|nr:IctB family putative bicarbonate transporter [Cyanobacterium aponinum]MTF40726.1 putative bicarbonate transporter, IctB family [Cyanobacterium aponinum 0216]